MATVRMTEGNIFRHLLYYAIPLILGNLFQLTYNAVDSIIVGRFIGKDALAAVGTANPVMNIVILGISGICIGAAVLMSEFFGAKDEAMLKKEIATTTVFGFFFSIVVAVLGIATAKPLLHALRVPDEILDQAAVYLRITFLGTPFTYFYNAVAAALKSVGDSKTPLKFLAFSAVLNAVLDLIFIGGLHFGIVCSATTTVIAEATSALLCIVYVYRQIPLLQLKKHELRLDRPLLRKTLQYGSITALQQSCQPIGKLLIQGAINPMGVDMIAAFNAVNRVDDYAFTPQQSIAQGITTFVAQNNGAKQPARIAQGLRRGLLVEFGYWVLICAAVAFLKTPIMGLFVTEGNRQIIELGTNYLSLMAVFYLFPSFTNGIQGFFRGMGNMSVTLLGTTIQTGLRVIFVYLLTPRLGIAGAAYACAIGWSVMLLVEVPYYFWYMKRQKWIGAKAVLSKIR